MYKMLDISHHQASFDAAKAAREGITDVACRACHGVAGPDSRWRNFPAAVTGAGMRLHAYAFCNWHHGRYNGGSAAKARQLMQEELHQLLGLLEGAGVTGWVALDQENEPQYDRLMSLGKEDNTQLLNEAAEIIRRAGYSPCVYCSASWVQTYIDTDKLTMPIWAACYYADPHDPDFDECASLEQLGGRWGDYLRSLGDKLCCWQYGRIGYGEKYGVGTANVDRDWIYSLPGESEKAMNFTPVANKELVVTSAEKPACEVFMQPDVDTAIGKLPKGTVLPILGEGDMVTVGGMTGVWCKVISAQDIAYVLALPDRCTVRDTAPVEPVEPVKPTEPRKLTVTLTVTKEELLQIADLLGM